MNNRRLFFSTIIVALAYALSANPLRAEEEKICDGTMKIIVQFAAGASTDIATRAIANALQTRLNQTIVVVNMPGAEGQIAAQRVHDAAPDFCTIANVPPAAVAIVPAEKKHKGEALRYDPRKLIALGKVAGTVFVLAVNPELPIHSMEELRKYAENHPFNMGVSYPLARVAAKLLQLSGIKLVPVSYGNGDTTSLPNLMMNEIQAAVLTLGAALPHINSGKIRPLFIIADARHPSIPDIQTAGEVGITELDAVPIWIGMLGPAGLSPEKVKRFNEALCATLTDPVIVKTLEGLAMKQSCSSPEELQDLMERQRKAWEDLAKKVAWFE